MQEIERKWLPAHAIDGMLNKFEFGEVVQVYLVVNDEQEVRIRRVRGSIWTGINESQYWLTVKARTAGTLYTRQELDVRLTKERFDELAKASIGIIQKVRFEIPVGTHTAEVDVFSYPVPWLRIIEVEFNSEAEALAFVPPPWFGKEVTHNWRYQNRNIALATDPSIYLD